MKLKFYAAHFSQPNYLYSFKVGSENQALKAVPRILKKFSNVTAIYFENSSGYSRQIYSSKKK